MDSFPIKTVSTDVYFMYEIKVSGVSVGEVDFPGFLKKDNMFHDFFSNKVYFHRFPINIFNKHGLLTEDNLFAWVFPCLKTTSAFFNEFDFQGFICNKSVPTVFSSTKLVFLCSSSMNSSFAFLVLELTFLYVCMNELVLHGLAFEEK